MIVQYSNMWEKYWVIFLGFGNQSEFFTLKLMGISFLIYEFSPYEHFLQLNYVSKSRDGCIAKNTEL
jgi:hypothetical protein